MAAARQMLSPEPGYWLVTLAKGGPRVPAAIIRCQTVVDPDFAENRMDGTRSPFLAAFIAGRPAALEEVWHRRGEVITESEYRFRIADAAWATEHKPDEPIAQPRKPVDWLRAPIPF